MPQLRKKIQKEYFSVPTTASKKMIPPVRGEMFVYVRLIGILRRTCYQQDIIWVVDVVERFP